jgi:HEPN domain-containing protein
VNRKDFQVLSAVRLKEAKVLLAAGLPDGAYYLAGYAVECALKACIARSTLRHDFPDKTTVDKSYTHSLTQLVGVASLTLAVSEQLNKDPLFKTNWHLVLKWSELTRYQKNSNPMAEDLMKAIEDKKHGVMAWLKRHY